MTWKRLSAVCTVLFAFACGAVSAMSADAPLPFFNVLDYGAVADGTTMNTEAFRRAVARVEAAGGGTVYVPPGLYLTGPIHFVDNMTLQVEGGATLKFTDDFDAYYPMVKVRFQGVDYMNFSPLLYAYQKKNITLCGRGTIDGQGAKWMEMFRKIRADSSLPNPPPLTRWQQKFNEANHDPNPEHNGFCRPQTFLAYECRNVTVRDVTLVNTPFWCVHLVQCDVATVDGISIFNPPGNNPDGINPESSRNIHIANCHIDTNDDCITIKAGKGPAARHPGNACENITITNCTMTGGAAAVGIGSEMSGDVRNVTVSNCVFNGTAAGIYIKTMRGRGGVVENVRVDNIVMINLRSLGIGLDMQYWRPTGPQPVGEGTPRFRNIHFSNITAKDVPTAIKVAGLEEMPIENVSFSNLHMSAKNGVTLAHARDVGLNDVTIDTASGPALEAVDVASLDIDGLATRTPHTGAPVVRLTNVQSAFVHGCFPLVKTGTFVELAGGDNADVVVDANNFRLVTTPVSVP